MLLHKHGLNIHKLPDAVCAQFPAEAALFNAAKGEPLIGVNEVVNEAAAGLKLVCSQVFGSCYVL